MVGEEEAAEDGWDVDDLELPPDVVNHSYVY